MIPSHTPTVGSVHFTTPPLSWITTFPPPPDPKALASPQSDSTFARPFNINPTLYNDLLHVAWPVTFALVYACTVTALNRVNSQREHKPWATNKSVVFYGFVLVHNIFLAMFSIWTFVGMINAVKETWPGFQGEGRLAKVADAFCKMSGPRGIGSAATYNTNTSKWSLTDRTMRLLNGAPDSTDVGRLWNEGLAFYGWLFYVSKFYEVVDTLIILSKGKTSSILQTFHHAGAMLCMWAGIRYMSPPIWMFVTVNSGLHGLMYTYYALSTLEIRTPQYLKRVLTFLQITQLVVGASYALGHLFIAYSRPVDVEYLFIHNLSTALPTAASALTSVISSATSTANLGSWLKKAALRAAGEEGLAENVRNAQGQHFGIDAVHAAAVEKAQEETRFRSELQVTHCLDTPGQVFAILLNALYLAPLTILFLRFFTQRYLTGTRQNVPPETRAHVAKISAQEAVHDLEGKVNEFMEAEQRAYEGTVAPPEIKAAIDSARDKLEALQAQLKKISTQSKEKGAIIADEVKQEANKASDRIVDMATEATDRLQRTIDALREKAQSAKEESEKKIDEALPEVKAKAEDVKDEVKETASDAKDKVSETKEQVKDSVTTNDGKSKANGAKRPSSKAGKSRIPKRDQSPAKRDPSPVKKDPKEPKPEPETNGDNASTQEPENVGSEQDKKTDAENDKKDDAEDVKKEDGQVDGEKQNGDDAEGTNGLDESAYEVNLDEVKSEEEMKKEAEMQPGEE